MSQGLAKPHSGYSTVAGAAATYERGPHWELRKRKASSLNGCASEPHTPHINPTAVEVHEWVQSSHCHQHDNTLRHGHLLRWMDITACLSGPLLDTSISVVSFVELHAMSYNTITPHGDTPHGSARWHFFPHDND